LIINLWSWSRFKEDSQAKANKLISIAEGRKDCVATISPYKGAVLNLTNTTTQTNNIVDFFSPISSSSYAIFDSGISIHMII